jgi:hypothetical protein
MAQSPIPFGSACRNEIQTLKPMALIDLAVPWQLNPGGMRRWRNGLRHWLIAGFRYAAQATAMREGHLWDVAPRVASGEHELLFIVD